MRGFVVKLRVSLLPWRHRARSGQLSFLRHFSNKNIKRATAGFSRIVARLSSGPVYRAKFQDGLMAMVKEVKTFPQGKDAFYKEVQLLGHLHHCHLVGLRGFSTGRERFLVFEYTEKGSLKEHLADPLKTPLNWKTRLQIATGVAAALEYLYFFCNPPIYHVSISSSNVLLDDNFNAKLSDVGLLGSCGNHMGKSHPLCSRECMDQESRNIIFQLGVLILELITGQPSEEDGTDIVQWVQDSNFLRSMHKMVDPDLGHTYDSIELRTLLTVARLCTKTDGNPKFSVQQILWYLQRKVEP
ncbi:probable receptor-like protein kinase At1g49730 isoform X1 [Telopea speciosissima]|uniref:probable receptor-like protein kinase At1g49730 isoform X1 n=1 Tax=Telopea speciosissima TaxID=54955 RepID=UPI001CC55BA3|nr:probable receptor-like protein kinase At1g49730 isoform X1 [Telopea speciosissima]